MWEGGGGGRGGSEGEVGMHQNVGRRTKKNNQNFPGVACSQTPRL